MLGAGEGRRTGPEKGGLNAREGWGVGLTCEGLGPEDRPGLEGVGESSGDSEGEGLDAGRAPLGDRAGAAGG